MDAECAVQPIGDISTWNKAFLKVDTTALFELLLAADNLHLVSLSDAFPMQDGRQHHAGRNPPYIQHREGFSRYSGKSAVNEGSRRRLRMLMERFPSATVLSSCSTIKVGTLFFLKG
ncbi:hypothetical protein HPB48_019023 [Haemaphysalis longicornis]|uniref:Uncharacterized protein n=1 Tax=Haemaphysalis longicornis TaxID=44386 RepID=A0A9J6FDU6_HAELO|nr:hypothetical protein HPB48_019023 [Haemaphysalis longicornis]